MRLLLDTHIFLWFISGDTRLSFDWRESIRDAENEVYVSVVSFWEDMIKHALGKLPLPQPPRPIPPASASTASASEFVPG
jgi:PIN domain nuclease of toxin-antitoxin system